MQLSQRLEDPGLSPTPTLTHFLKGVNWPPRPGWHIDAYQLSSPFPSSSPPPVDCTCRKKKMLGRGSRMAQQVLVLAASVKTWVQSLRPGWWKERTVPMIDFLIDNACTHTIHKCDFYKGRKFDTQIIPVLAVIVSDCTVVWILTWLQFPCLQFQGDLDIFENMLQSWN